jgi:Ca2+-binding EF-hand superfamily protein
MFDDVMLEKYLSVGKGMVMINDDYIRRALKGCVIKFIKLNDKYYFVGAIESNILKSEIGNNILVKSDYDLNFSMIFSHNYIDNHTYFSLRSLDEKTDVSEIAKLFNGGGHRNAAGMSLNYISSGIGKELDNNKLYKVLDNAYLETYDGNNLCFVNNSYLSSDLVKFMMQKRNKEKEVDLLLKTNIDGCISYYKSNNEHHAILKVSYKIYNKIKDHGEITYSQDESIITYKSNICIKEFLKKHLT